jgi:hypothetical protein
VLYTDWLVFIEEGRFCIISATLNALIVFLSLNVQTTIHVYKSLLKFAVTTDAKADARGEGPLDQSINPHF